MAGTVTGGVREEGARVSRGFSVRAGAVALRRSLTLCRITFSALGQSLYLTSALTLIWPGPGLLPRALARVRRLSERQRELALSWSGVEIPAPLEPSSSAASSSSVSAVPVPKEISGVYGRLRWLLHDPRSRREARWVLAEPVIGALLAFTPVALVLSGCWGVFLAFFGLRLSQVADGLWFEFIPIMGPVTATVAGVIGLAQLPFALWAAPRVLAVHARYTRAMLAPSEAELLAGRVRHLAATRSEAVDTQMAEIRRIERDLHDGAQARLVAMGMTLDAAEHLLETNPAAVRGLLIEARESSTKALEELRDLVRGIHPPVLADRGLVDAVRALALVCPVPTRVEAALPGRPEMPVESAAYFAVSELLANVAKHSGADWAEIDLRYDHGVLRVSVADGGSGGADAALGTGLRGIERRLATFDGVLAVSSPAHGPTIVTLEVPCALSSPKTTSS
ncbi:histidine kinase [Kitasatospora sp. MMS16-BH015]|uniref:sensor histidine kinase n=1 Tax=Kitasatospora sp. MMS16-BH015 TaxID=2018025 RepID=UPI000CA3C0F1|nr:histidine kinase [Kitasatospora sp. MMS16-BH015]AUG80643.1 histidine kinase [Kitasatospora sp. MMS16-BH015]